MFLSTCLNATQSFKYEYVLNGNVRYIIDKMTRLGKRGASSVVLLVALITFIGITAFAGYMILSKGQLGGVSSITIEAEAMRFNPNLASANSSALTFHGNGYASKEVKLPKGWAGRNIMITMTARADSGTEELNVAPHRKNHTLILPVGITSDDVLRGDLNIDPNATLKIDWLIQARTGVSRHAIDTANYSELVNYLIKKNGQIGQDMYHEEEALVTIYRLVEIKASKNNFTFVYEGNRTVDRKWPIVGFSVNNVKMDYTVVHSDKWTDFQFPPILFDGDTHTIGLWLTNYENKTLYIDRIKIRPQ